MSLNRILGVLTSLDTEFKSLRGILKSLYILPSSSGLGDRKNFDFPTSSVDKLYLGMLGEAVRRLNP